MIKNEKMKRIIVIFNIPILLLGILIYRVFPVEKDVVNMLNSVEELQTSIEEKNYLLALDSVGKLETIFYGEMVLTVSSILLIYLSVIKLLINI